MPIQVKQGNCENCHIPYDRVIYVKEAKKWFCVSCLRKPLKALDTCDICKDVPGVYLSEIGRYYTCSICDACTTYLRQKE